ncbi:MAG: response regulator transcription factor [Nitrospinae bacterium]|nr:response regulator transcription factor [Nitrospinota bacterium]
MRLLIVEDDPVLRNGLDRSFRQTGHKVDCVEDGHDADAALTTQVYDAVILDLGLPGMDGLEILKRLRGRKSPTPVLVLTARDTVAQRVAGLDMGADDYLTKPFDLSELEARVRSLVRRSKASGADFIQVGALKIDVAGKRAMVGEIALDLSSRELGVLEALASMAGRIMDKERLAARLCGMGEEIGSNAIEVYVHRVRKKLEPYGVNIRTVRGLGYLLDGGK